ncbi:FAD-dependent oxidoreductase [Heliobacterium mobile]|uniref:FAD-dependent oxidoreductase n=1 Tax=Heliobacterium mobile TaxID=28064 RepID=UPI0038B28596
MSILIIGNSAAGVAAAETVRQMDPSVNVTMVSAEPYASYSRCVIREVISGKKKT